MRFVDLRAYKPSDEWLDKAKAATMKLRSLNSQERATFLRSAAAAAIWGELREELVSLSHDRCWYTEAPIGAGDAQVEHFRPKLGYAARLDEEHIGYWWLAFDFSNYRISASIPNRTKSSAFPVLGVRVEDEGGEVIDECPVLLDPAVFSDTLLLSFVESGLAVPSPEASGDEVARVEYSIRRYGLNTGAVVRARQQRWLDCMTAIKSWQMARVGASRSPSRRALVESYAQIVRQMTHEAQPYVSTVHACVRLHADRFPLL